MATKQEQWRDSDIMLCDCGLYPIYPGSDECRVCDGSYRLTDEERENAIYSLSHSQAVALATMCAEEVLPLWKGGDAPAKAIQAAKNWLKKPTKKNSIVVRNAVRGALAHADPVVDPAAHAAASAAASAASAAHAAAHAAASAASAVYAIGVASTVQVATLYATDSDSSMPEKIDRWLYEN